VMSAPAGVGLGVGVGVGVGAGVGVLCLPVETPPQAMSSIAGATAERRGMNLKRINPRAQLAQIRCSGDG
jgi:hypothetical protein